MACEVNAIALLDRIRRVCARLGVEVRLVPGAFIEDTKAAGFFDDSGPTLTVAIGRADWLEVFAHEYGHAIQWAEEMFTDDATGAAYEGFEEWVERRADADPESVTRWVRLIQACERDAERRAVSTLVEEGLLPDPTAYIRHANAYVLQYEAARLTRCWVKGFSSDTEAMQTVPPVLVDTLDALPPAFIDLYRSRCA